MEIESGLQDLLDEYFKNSDYKIIEIVFRGEKGTKVLEIFVDNKEGISIDGITGITKDLNALIDEKLVINDISNLMVSSPGAGRAIRFLWQLHKHMGRKLDIELNNGEKVEGELTGISDTGEGNIDIVSSIKEKGKKSRTEQRIINFKDIKEVKVKISFSKK